MDTGKKFQSALEAIIADAIWDGLSRSAISAILAAQAEIQKHNQKHKWEV